MIQGLFLISGHSWYSSAKESHLIGNDAKEIWREIIKFKNQLQVLQDLNLNPLPFVYKTVVVFVVYLYLILSVVAEQDIGKTHIQLYFPLFGCLYVIFFVGWLKAGIVMENPLEADFQLEKIFERHLRLITVLLADDEPNFVMNWAGKKEIIL